MDERSKLTLCVLYFLQSVIVNNVFIEDKDVKTAVNLLLLAIATPACVFGFCEYNRRQNAQRNDPDRNQPDQPDSPENRRGMFFVDINNEDADEEVRINRLGY